MTDLATIPQLASDRLTEMGEAVGELDGQQFYAVRVVVATRPDGSTEVLGLLDEWKGTLAGRLISAQAELVQAREELERLKAKKTRKQQKHTTPAPVIVAASTAPASTPPCPHCGRAFADSRGRHKHVTHCTGPASAPPPADPPPAPEPCPHCGRIFSHALGRQRHIDSCARRQAEPPPEPEPAASPFPEPPAPAVPRRVRFGEQALTPRWQENPPPRPAAMIERHQCPSCLRSFDSIPAYNRHTCKPAPARPAAPPYADPPPPIIPDDPAEAAEELARLTAGRWPRPCPECWAQSVLTMLKGPAGMAAHRKAAHGIVPMLARPAIAWAPGGWRCADCGSAAFARDLHDESICVRCAAERKQAATA